MRKIKLYIAASIDGFIADKNGSVEWLEKLPNPDLLDYGYFEMYNNIDTTLMGNATYQQILGFDIPFPYKDKQNVVFTRNKSLTKDENAIFISDDIINFVKNLKTKKGKAIWLIGGGQINTILLNADLIDEMIISYIPTVLGEGIPLFSSNAQLKSFRLLKSETYNTGVISLTYVK
ncbi:MAG: dihydrofolate reductase family protein [Saprospiraceae bacterium]